MAVWGAACRGLVHEAQKPLGCTPPSHIAYHCCQPYAVCLALPSCDCESCCHHKARHVPAPGALCAPGQLHAPHWHRFACSLLSSIPACIVLDGTFDCSTESVNTFVRRCTAEAPYSGACWACARHVHLVLSRPSLSSALLHCVASAPLRCI